MNAVRDFGRGRGASDEHILLGSVRSEQRSLRPKDPPPGGFSIAYFRNQALAPFPHSEINEGNKSCPATGAVKNRLVPFRFGGS